MAGTVIAGGYLQPERLNPGLKNPQDMGMFSDMHWHVIVRGLSALIEILVMQSSCLC